MSVLICETLFEPISLITEDVDGKKQYFIEGVFLQAELKNRNGRIYPARLMEREVEKYTKSHIESNRAYGELGHPAGPGINLHLVSHMTKSLQREGNDWIGRAKVLDTPNGRIVKNLLDEGAGLGTSSRGVGSLKSRQGLMEVQDDFHLAVAGDVVADPSAPSAFVRGIMENVEWVYDLAEDCWKMEESLHNTKKILHSMSLQEINSKKLIVFENFLKDLSSPK